MRRPSRSGLSLVFVLCANIPLTAQNIASIGKEKPFSFTGALSVNQVWYNATGIQSRRDPYAYFASANANLSLYGWSIPLSFSLSNRSHSFSQPFNHYSLHPTYKWITVHAGYTSQSFSPYTVNGHIFSGVAVEIEPEGNWNFSALYGRFLKSVEADTTKAHTAKAAFKRMGYGFKTSYGKGGNSIDLIIFHAADDPHSIRPQPDSTEVTPMENLVVSVGGGKAFFEHFRLKAEFSASALTKDTRATEARNDHPLTKSGILFTPRISSYYYNAFKTSFDYRHNGYLVGLAYERIDPHYRTLGAYYFNNDLESFTVNVAAGASEGAIQVAANAGIQRDNLDGSKISTLRRMVGAVNINYRPTTQLNFTASWSTFRTYTNIRSQFTDINQLTPYDNLDTLNFTQISKNASFSGMYTLRGLEKRSQHVNLHLTYQAATDAQGEAAQLSGIRYYNVNSAYSLMMVPRQLSVSLSVNGTFQKGGLINTTMLGPTAAMSKSWWNRKFRTTLSSSYNKSYGNGTALGSVMNWRLNGTVSLKKKHNITITTGIVHRKNAPVPKGNVRGGTNGKGSKRFSEFTGTLGYAFKL